MSPSRRVRLRDGTPCTTSSLIEMQIEAGKTRPATVSPLEAGGTVVLEHGRGLARVDLHAVADGLLAVVGALHEPPAAAVAAVRLRGRVEARVEHGAALLAHAPPRQALERVLAGQGDQEDA